MTGDSEGRVTFHLPNGQFVGSKIKDVKYLIDRMQMPAAKVNALPPAQVILLHLVAVNEELQDEAYKGAYLPATQAMPILLAANKRLKELPDSEATRLPLLLTAAVHHVVVAQNRLERKIAGRLAVEGGIGK